MDAAAALERLTRHAAKGKFDKVAPLALKLLRRQPPVLKKAHAPQLFALLEASLERVAKAKKEDVRAATGTTEGSAGGGRAAAADEGARSGGAAAAEAQEAPAAAAPDSADTIDLGRARDPRLRAAYKALFEAADAAPVLRMRHREQLDVWAITVVLEARLHTDESFEFARAVKEVVQALDALPPLEPEEGRVDCAGEAQQPGAGGDPEHARQMRLLMARREALVGCVEVALARWKGALWARTTAEQAVAKLNALETLSKLPPVLKGRAVAARDGLQDLKSSKKGKGGALVGDDTSFERDQRRWASSAVSARGAIGGNAAGNGFFG